MNWNLWYVLIDFLYFSVVVSFFWLKPVWWIAHKAMSWWASVTASLPDLRGNNNQGNWKLLQEREVQVQATQESCKATSGFNPGPGNVYVWVPTGEQWQQMQILPEEASQPATGSGAESATHSQGAASNA